MSRLDSPRPLGRGNSQSQDRSVVANHIAQPPAASEVQVAGAAPERVPIEFHQPSDLLSHFEEGTFVATVTGSSRQVIAVPLASDRGQPPRLLMSGLKGESTRNHAAETEIRNNTRYRKLDGSVATGNVLLVSDTIEEFRLDRTDPKQIKALIEAATAVAKYLGNYPGSRELLLPSSIVSRQGRAAYVPGYSVGVEWPRGVEPFVDTTTAPPEKFDEKFYAQNLWRVLFWVVHERPWQPGLSARDKTLQALWPKLQDLQTIDDVASKLTVALGDKTPSSFEIESPPSRNPDRFRGLILTTSLGAAIGAGWLLYREWPKLSSLLSGSDPTGTSPSVPGSGAGVGGGGTGTGTGAVAPAKDQAKPGPGQATSSAGQTTVFPPQLLFFYDAKKVKEPDLDKVTFTIKGIPVDKGIIYKDYSPELQKNLEARLKRIADTDKITVDADGIWTITGSRRPLSDIFDDLLKEAWGTGYPFVWPGAPRTVIAGLFGLRMSGEIGKSRAVMGYYFTPLANTFGDNEWVSIDVIHTNDGKSLKPIDMTKPGVEVQLDIRFDSAYDIHCNRENGGEDIIYGLILASSDREKLLKHLKEFFDAAGMKQFNPELYVEEKEKGNFTTKILELLIALRLHFNPSGMVDPEKFKSEQEQRLNARSKSRKTYEYKATAAPTGTTPAGATKNAGN